MRGTILFSTALFAFANASSSGATPTLSDVTEDAARYEACVNQTTSDAQQAFETAITWRDEGGGSAANHCAALALLEMGAEEEAAYRLEKIAVSPDAGGQSQRAAILSQAGNAWLLAGRPAEAQLVLTSAIDLTPNNPTLYFERAQALNMQEQYQEVVQDTTRAIALDRHYSDAYVLRASAYIELGNLANAQGDIDSALRFDPQNVAAALQLGRLRQMRKDG